MAYAPWLMMVVEGRKPEWPNFKYYHWNTFKR